MSRTSIALNRFGLGARLEDRPPDDPEGWLRAQFDSFDPTAGPIAAAPDRREVATDLADSTAQLRQTMRHNRNRSAGDDGQSGDDAMPEDQNDRMSDVEMSDVEMSDGQMDGRQRRRARNRGGDEMAERPNRRARNRGRTPPMAGSQQAIRNELRVANRDYYQEMVGARTNAALTTPAPFIERLVHFWANHFAVSIDKITVIAFAGLLEFDAIRPNVLGKFEDMLLAVETHPAMLFYLDQSQSIGPASQVGQAGGRHQRGLNENLAREALELHTLGVDGGYSQADVTEFARALTGWSVNGVVRQRRIARFLDGEPGTFAFAEELHEPGARAIMGNRYPEGGEEQGRAILLDAARHPATARHLATKLARHFAGDEPPAALVDRLARAFQQGGGDLPTVYRALLDSPEAWVDEPVKFKSPWEWQISALRAVGTRDVADRAAVATMNQLGQPVWKPGSPAGYDDLAGRWAGPDALVRRVEFASELATRSGDRIDPRALASRLFPGQLSEATAQSIARAESESQGLALLLVSPEFQRR